MISSKPLEYLRWWRPWSEREKLNRTCLKSRALPRTQPTKEHNEMEIQFYGQACVQGLMSDSAWRNVACDRITYQRSMWSCMVWLIVRSYRILNLRHYFSSVFCSQHTNNSHRDGTNRISRSRIPNPRKRDSVPFGRPMQKADSPFVHTRRKKR